MEEEKKSPVVEENKQSEPAVEYVSKADFQELRDRLDKFFEHFDSKKSEPENKATPEPENKATPEPVKPVSTDTNTDSVTFDDYCYQHFDKRKGE